VTLKDYRDTIASIQQKHGGTRVGASESIFAYVALATGLDLITPETYLNAISEGAEPTAADKATVQRQIEARDIKVLVFNSQNSTPELEGLVAKAKAGGIPVVRMTETMVPATTTFQAWQTTQLQELLHALGD
jgi:zinc/manganese transport system substrate-binding protein